MNKPAINTIGDELEASAAYCRSQNIGLEITDFAYPRNLDQGLEARIVRHAKAVEGVTPLIAHGPFFELIVASPDPAIVAVARHRHTTALDAVARLGVSLYIAHAGFMPLIRNASYRETWTRRTLDFWLPFADRAGKENITICLENVWEPVPEIQAELMARGNHPHLRATFDNGHALVDSKLSAGCWISTLGPVLSHCHLHDNSGESDEHKAIGEGIENWPELLKAVEKNAPGAILVAESDRLTANKISIERLRSLSHRSLKGHD